jgi:small multidrug resistance pump/quaternary ammonium compound-resistance protein SugE
MALTQLLLASAAYALGGLFMKRSGGLSHGPATLAFLALFVGGSVLQALGMKDTDLGVSYIFVLGVEALLAVVFSVFYLHESYAPSRMAAIALVVVGVAWLRLT